MIVVIRDWYRARTPREQRLILVMLAVAIPLLVWLALILPLSSAYDDALQRNLQAVDRNGRVKALAERATGGPARTAPAGGGDLALALTDSARQSGFTAQANPGPAPGSIAIAVTAASPPAILAWLNQLEGQGYRITDVRIAPTGPGAVAVSATIAGAAR